MTEPNAPAPGAEPGSPRAEREEHARRAHQDLGRAAVAVTIAVAGLEGAPKNLFPPPSEVTAADYAELWSAASMLLVESQKYLLQTANNAMRAVGELLNQR
jgi:hypothetical protein